MSGSRLPWAFLVELGAAMIVASTIVPPRRLNPAGPVCCQPPNPNPSHRSTLQPRAPPVMGGTATGGRSLRFHKGASRVFLGYWSNPRRCARRVGQARCGRRGRGRRRGLPDPSIPGIAPARPAPPPRGKPCARAARMKTRLSMSRQARWATSNARPSDHRRLRAARRLGLVLCRRSGSRTAGPDPAADPALLLSFVPSLTRRVIG